ncbi:MAG: M1 family metallopeptidase [Myxococcota bacterium]|nr:M1 family metallopeptidase [Myxococcota bacterium]
MNTALVNIIIALFLSLIFAPFPAAASPAPASDPPLSPRIANYDIDVRLDTAHRLLHGEQVLRWRNPSGDEIGALQFHLYLNAFRNTQSTAFVENTNNRRRLKTKAYEWGGIDVHRMALPSGQDLTDKIEFIHPDDDNTEDKTVIQVPLPTPLLPGQEIVLHIDFTAKLPSPPVRTGAMEEYVFVAQWFPKIGVYEDGQWNCHQFHAWTEFFADFGVYDVRITVPKEHIVGATGIEVGVAQNDDGTATHHYRAEDVHDFAWTASPEFVVFQGHIQDVDIRVLMQPDHVGQGPRYLAAAAKAIAYLQDWIGDYPFPNLTVVDPRRRALGSGGMEYPTLITAGTTYAMPTGIRFPEIVIIHEVAHNYWYHLLATNEFEASYLDEGFTQYAELKMLQDFYGDANAIDFLGVQLSATSMTRAGYMAAPDQDVTARPAWTYYSGISYRNNSYHKPALVLLTLENYVGEKTMQDILRTHFARWQFKHPTLRDFIDIAEEVAGTHLSQFFHQAFYTNAVLDYAVDAISTAPVKEPAGYDVTLTPFSDKDIQPQTKPGQALYRSEVNIRRLGAFTFPVEVLITFESGETRLEQWDGKNLWKRFTYIKPIRIRSAEIDPKCNIPLDINFTNNSKTIAPIDNGLVKQGTAALFLFQLLLEMPELTTLVSLISKLL